MRLLRILSSRTIWWLDRASVATAIAVWLILVFGLTACTGLPAAPPASPSFAMAAQADTPLWQLANRTPLEPGSAGLALAPIGSAAFRLRLALTAQARHTLDLQYYAVHDDRSGRGLLRSLRDASQRGVRVRLLVDDLHTADTEQLLLAFAAHEGIEVRLFNPIPNGRWGTVSRVIGSVFDWGRINRRMHNKLFVADNAMAVLGGRNIGDEYFMRGSEHNFVDVDVLAAGGPVATLSQGFDSYWNSPLSYPVASLVRSPLDAAALRMQFDTLTAGTLPPPEDATVPARLQAYAVMPEQIASGEIDMVQAPVKVLIDPVSKATRFKPDSRASTVRASLIDELQASQTEVLVVSPYFVPGLSGVSRMKALIERGVHIRLLTNSLAANDEPLVHIGYAAYRALLLRAGVEIFELSPQLARSRGHLGRFGSSVGSLHAKVAVIDRQRLFIGSMNFDPRSEAINTEMGLLIDSPALAEAFLNLVDYRDSAYRLRLAPNQQDVEWITSQDGVDKIHGSEPESSWLLRLKLWLISPLVPLDQL